MIAFALAALCFLLACFVADRLVIWHLRRYPNVPNAFCHRCGMHLPPDMLARHLRDCA
jgi:hypothetical protein